MTEKKKTSKRKPKPKKTPPPRQQMLERIYEELGAMETVLGEMEAEPKWSKMESTLLAEIAASAENIKRQAGIHLKGEEEPPLEQGFTDDAEEGLEKIREYLKDLEARLSKLEARPQLDEEKLEIRIIDNLIKLINAKKKAKKK